jgi:xanthine dehydrogenase small subunit
VPRIEAALEGQAPEQITADQIDAAIAASFTPRDGLRATWAYRSLVARNLILSFVQTQSEEALS